jgi:Cytochrome P460
MVKDSKRFADSGGWGWGAFEYDAASDTFRSADTTDSPPQEHDAKCGFSCHTIVKNRDSRSTERGEFRIARANRVDLSALRMSPLRGEPECAGRPARHRRPPLWLAPSRTRESLLLTAKCLNFAHRQRNGFQRARSPTSRGTGPAGRTLGGLYLNPHALDEPARSGEIAGSPSRPDHGS